MMRVRRRLFLVVGVVAVGVGVALLGVGSKSETERIVFLLSDFEVVAHQRIGPREAWVLRAPKDVSIAQGRVIGFVRSRPGWQLPLGVQGKGTTAFFDPSLAPRPLWRRIVPFSVVPELRRFVSVQVEPGFLVNDPLSPFPEGAWTSVKILSSGARATIHDPIPLNDWRYSRLSEKLR